MPRTRRYYRDGSDEEGEGFETEAFSHMNDDEPEDSKPENDQEWESEDSDPEDVQEKPDADSDDEAPDDIGFHDSRQSVLSQLRTAMRQVDSLKQKKKDQRKQLETQFKEQKAKKREYLEQAKLPEDILQSVEEAIPQKIQKTENVKKSLGRKDENGKKRRHKNKRKAKDKPDNDDKQEDKKESRDLLKEDYIAFTNSASGVEVADLKHLDRQSKTVEQIAADFKQRRLYGSGIVRESNQQRLAKKEKRRHRAR